MKYFDKKLGRLVFIARSATPDFWDEQWDIKDLERAIRSGSQERFVSKTTKRYLLPTADHRILEGGCGKGNFVYSLRHHGYDAYGVDFAEETVRKINTLVPELRITVADVRKLPFADNYFDGYWSLGVIEHFYEGYGAIADEMRRVIRPGGFLFLTFPYLSPLRKLKIFLGHYPNLPKNNAPPVGFYQFALDHKKTIADFVKLGFECIETRPFEGFKGFKEEVSKPLKDFLQKIYDCKALPCKIIDFILSHSLAPISGHTILVILKKKS